MKASPKALNNPFNNFWISDLAHYSLLVSHLLINQA